MLKGCHRMFAQSVFRLCVVLLLAGGMILGQQQERRSPALRGGVQHNDNNHNRILKAIEEECRVARQNLDLFRRGVANPEIVSSVEWKEVNGRVDEAGNLGCPCPFVDARVYTERLRRMQLARLNPRARAALFRPGTAMPWELRNGYGTPATLQNFDYAIQKNKEKLEAIIRETEECFQINCKESLRILGGEYTTDPPPRGGGSSRPSKGDAPAPTSPLLDYIHGIGDGLRECWGFFFDHEGFVACMLRGDFITAAHILGCDPGEHHVFLRALWQDMNNFHTGVGALKGEASPYQLGITSSRRFCAYFVMPRVLGAKQTFGKGGNPANPLRGKALADAAAKNPEGLAGKWVDLELPGQTKPVQLGKHLGKGSTAGVYRVEGNPGIVYKIGNGKPSSAAGFKGHIEGNRLLEENGVPTPKIHYERIAPYGEPSILVIEDIYARWPGAKIAGQLLERSGLGNLFRPILPQPRAEAIRNLLIDIGSKGILWTDPHLANIFVYEEGGQLWAGVVEAGEVFPARKLAGQDLYIKKKLSSILDKAGTKDLMDNPKALPIMRSLYWYHIGSRMKVPEPQPGGPRK